MTIVNGWVYGSGDMVAVKIGRKTVHGKWGDPAVPSYNWTCESIDEIEYEHEADNLEFCGMCEYKEIRIVHFMTHPDFSMYNGEEVNGIVAGRYCAPCMRSDGSKEDIKDKRGEVYREERNFKARKARKIKKEGK